ncbi:MAG: hypothetical protein A2Y14_01055 [Verrucomicrobia bacterium GWF2_51_19]|nr:MAG: hypothetical protein A2Y14_01055 [Verrucomicrobia bacterium GWF2_51_19]HCJ12072.1 hypothetical protein [Opitutae bacterium]
MKTYSTFKKQLVFVLLLSALAFASPPRESMTELILQEKWEDFINQVVTYFSTLTEDDVKAICKQLHTQFPRLESSLLKDFSNRTVILQEIKEEEDALYMPPLL